MLVLLCAIQSCEPQPGGKPLTFPGSATTPDGLTIRLVGGPAGWFEVRGLLTAPLPDGWLDPGEWKHVLAVYVENSAVPVVGDYSKRGSTLRFQPRFPLVDEVPYRAVCDPRRVPGSRTATEPVVTNFQMPPRKGKPTTVVGNVFPTASVLPENLLRFYVHFSEPMRRGEAQRHIHLLDGTGKPIAGAFLDEELWDPDGARLTLLLDPGRVKRGYAARDEAGPILEEGKKYTLVIDRDWKDAHGCPLKEAYRKGFRAGPAERAAVDPDAWTITAPAAGRHNSVAVEFGRPLDRALLERMLHITDAAGNEMSGVGAIGEEETGWKFALYGGWPAGVYYLVADPSLEDPSGNSVAQPFERDASLPAPAPRNNRVAFRIEGSGRASAGSFTP
jgi:hypothetical protein